MRVLIGRGERVASGAFRRAAERETLGTRLVEYRERSRGRPGRRGVLPPTDDDDGRLLDPEQRAAPAALISVLAAQAGIEQAQAA